MEATPGVEPGKTELQSVPLPLGEAAISEPFKQLMLSIWYMRIGICL